MTADERAAITKVLGALPDSLLFPLRDARGQDFQRLEFLGDAVLELVVRFHALVAGSACDLCQGDADQMVTDEALASAASSSDFGEWLEWEASTDRLADLIEACAGAVWLTSGWKGLGEFVNTIVHPITPLTAQHFVTGWGASIETGGRRASEIVGASIIETAAARIAFSQHSGNEHQLTNTRNRLYASRRVVERAERASILTPADRQRSQREIASGRDEVEKFLADLALARGLKTAVARAKVLLR